MQQNAKIKISWGSGFIPSAKHTAQDKLISNLFIIIFSSQAIYYSLFISFFSCFFFYPHMSYVICLVPVISTLPTFEFQHIFIFFLFFWLNTSSSSSSLLWVYHSITFLHLLSVVQYQCLFSSSYSPISHHEFFFY